MPNDRLIFVTGASRSGTTLMSFILRNHPEVLGLKESHYFGGRHVSRQLDRPLERNAAVQAAAWLLARQEKGVLAAAPDASHERRAGDIVSGIDASERTTANVYAHTIRLLCEDAGRPIACEQTPRNIYYAKELLASYPNAQVVHMLRDPRAVMASQKRRWQRRRLATDAGAVSAFQSLRTWMNYHPYTMTNLWRRATRLAADLEDHPRFTIARFEDLLDGPERTVRILCERLGLDFDPRMLDVGQVNSSHKSSVGGARRGIHKDAASSWRNTLTSTEAAIVERDCGGLMDHFGYETFGSGLSATSGLGEWRFRLTYPWHAAGVLLVNPRRAFVQLQGAFARRGSASP